MNLPDNTLLQGGKYRINRFISSGGFGCTYEAELVLLHKRVAIKEFFVKDFCNREENTSHITVATQSKIKLIERLKKKFIEEASALFSMQHPNIVRVTDVFEENCTAYYVMDYIDGKSLQDIVKEKGSLDEDSAISYISQIAGALKYVHSQNRLHLDVKPGNIMIDENNQAILIDFGASKQYDEVEGENTSTLLGKTPGYAPLEQIGNEVGKFLPATDIYALGATFYKLLSGITPISATLLASGDNLEILPETISKSTRQAIYAAMEINKNNRPQNVDEFIELLYQNVNNDDDSTLLEIPFNCKSDDKTKIIIETNSNTYSEKGTKKGLTVLKGTLLVLFVLFISVFIILQNNYTESSISFNNQGIDENLIDSGLLINQTPAKTSLYIRSNPDNADVYIDGQYVGRTPMVNKIDKGTFQVKLIKYGYKTNVQNVSSKGKTIVINENLELDNQYSNAYGDNNEYGTNTIYDVNKEEHNNTSKSRGVINGYEYVDLGLSVKWAAYNIGTYSPEGEPFYFAWGSTMPHNGSTKIPSVSYSVIWGESKYDAARAIWKGSWRMPTYSEAYELISNCDWKWSTINGRNGYTVTGPNGNSIFLPAYGTQKDASNFLGYYWIGESINSTNAKKIFFNSDGYYLNDGHKNIGCAIRPVTR